MYVFAKFCEWAYIDFNYNLKFYFKKYGILKLKDNTKIILWQICTFICESNEKSFSTRGRLRYYACIIPEKLIENLPWPRQK